MFKLKSLIVTSCLVAASCVYAGHVTTAKDQQAMQPKDALQKLMNGNMHFITQDFSDKNYTKILKQNAKGQHPFAFVFNCVDSRSVPEILFDQAPGNIFVGRIAGNVVDRNVLGSMEYAVKYAGSKLIVIMGHTSCGAVTGACKNLKSGNLTGLLAQIRPAVLSVKKVEKKQFSCKSSDTINAIARQNVLNQMRQVLRYSHIIRTLVKARKVALVGAMQDIPTGKVQFFTQNGALLK